ELPQLGGGHVERLVPADPLPAWIWITLRSRALQGMEQPILVVDEFRRCLPLGAERLPGRVRGVRFQRHEAAVLDDGDRAAPRDAQRAVAADPLGDVLRRCHRDSSRRGAQCGPQQPEQYSAEWLTSPASATASAHGAWVCGLRASATDDSRNAAG